MAIRYDPPAAAAVRALMDDRGRKVLADRVLAALRVLDAEPGDHRCRSRLFHPVVDWGMTVRTRDDDWLILWDWDADENLPRVRYVGPDL
jgi:hypothetical protein